MEPACGLSGLNLPAAPASPHRLIRPAPPPAFFYFHAPESTGAFGQMSVERGLYLLSGISVHGVFRTVAQIPDFSHFPSNIYSLLRSNPWSILKNNMAIVFFKLLW
jgi:hypothetical protein